jgi:putative sugar O-methyltransferase
MTQSTNYGFDAIVESARRELCYKNYLSVRASVLSMLHGALANRDAPSRYWEEELAGFDYMLDASPLIVQKIREHSYHITGLKSYEYRLHHAHQAGPFKEKLAALRAEDRNDLFVPEAPELGGFGHLINGQLVNIDTLKFYESLIALDRAGFITGLRNQNTKPIVVEIGGGWGGFAYQFKKICSRSTYIIVDLPQTLIFSGVYLKTLFPELNVFVSGDNGHVTPPGSIDEYDFILMPHYAVDDFQPSRIDLGINMVSFQEMTTQQVFGYAKWFWNCGCQALYSHNRARSAHNTQLTDVAHILRHWFDMQEQKVLPVPYTVLRLPQPTQWSLDPKKMGRQIIEKMLYPMKKMTGSHLDYRHLVGLRRNSPDGVPHYG